MSNFSDDLVILRGVRNAGVPHPSNPQMRVGGRYHPAFTNAGGEAVSARWTGSLAMNKRGYRNPITGVVTEVDPKYLRITAWTGKNSAGNGMAERYARFMSIGLELSVNCLLKPYDADQYDAGVRVCRLDGTPIQVERMGFTIIPGSTMIGSESEKHIADEITKYGTSQGTQGRPPQWDIRGSEGHGIWQQLIAKKNAEMYQPGMTALGYAVVIPPKNAQGTAYTGAQPLNANTLVDGFTYDQWLASNPNFDELALANPKFQVFHAMIQAKMVAGKLAVPGLTTPAGQPVVVNQPVEGAFENSAY